MDQPTTPTPEQPKDTEVKVETATPTPVVTPAPTIPSATPPPPPAPTPPTPPSLPDEHTVSLRTTLLIVFLAILAAVLLFVALKPAKKVVTNQTGPTPTVSPAHSTLSLSLATPSASAGANATAANVNIDTQSNEVSSVQFEISYDPTVLTNVKVTPGDFFTNPLTLLNQVDTKNGKINFAVGIQPTAKGIKGNGTVAVISYTILPTQTSSTTKLAFLPKTQVIQQGVLGSVLQNSSDLSIPIQGLTSTPSGKTALPSASQQ